MTGLEVMVGEVPVDPAERRGRGCKISPHQARPMRQMSASPGGCPHTYIMREAFAHEAVLVMEPGADVRAPGAAIAVALCGHWNHEPPCLLAPHRVSADEDDGELRVRILFAVEPDTEGEVRRLIDQALSGQLKFPDGFTTPWRLRTSWPSEVSAEETDNAERLIRS